jgi:hypothetical protein
VSETTLPESGGAAGAALLNAPYLRVECSPTRLLLGLYDRLPFPTLGPVQEVAFDVGVTAYHATIQLTGLVFKGYAGHQMLFEQRWPARVIRQRTGEANLDLPANTGIALKGLHFMLHGYEPLTAVEITALGKRAGAPAPLQAIAQIPVDHKTQRTRLHLPVTGTWWVVQGSDWSDQHKLEPFSQAFALDLVKLGAESRFFTAGGHRLEDHYSWNQPVYAAAGGKVAFVRYDMPDLLPGVQPDPRLFRGDMMRLLGNAVAIRTARDEFCFYGHLQQASLQVSTGQVIKRGALLGRVGNSGFSPGPHLHFHLAEGPHPFIDRGLPACFSHFEAGGQRFSEPTLIPTRMIITSAEGRGSTAEDI